MSHSRCVYRGNHKIGSAVTFICSMLMMVHIPTVSSSSPSVFKCSKDIVFTNDTARVTNSNGCACFNSRTELKKAVDKFIEDGCSDNHNCNNEVVQKFGWPMGSWCVSSVVNMDALFLKKKTFNDDISAWDTSKVTTMDHMFYRAREFNQPIGKWDTSKVQSMAYVLAGATSFNQPLSQWDLSKCTTMYNMFNSALAFNQDVSAWDTSSVTTMEKMFWGAISFNQDVSTWDTSSVRDMTGMFIGASSFNQPLNRWDVSKVTSMHRIFEDATSFNQPLGQWRITSLKDMAGMFRKASSFHQDLSAWDVSKINDADAILEGTAVDLQVVCHWGDDWKRIVKVDCTESKPTWNTSAAKKASDSESFGAIHNNKTLYVPLLVFGIWYILRRRNRSKRHSH